MFKKIIAEYESLMVRSKIVSMMPMILVIFLCYQLYKLIIMVSGDSYPWYLIGVSFASKLIILGFLVFRLILVVYRDRVRFGFMALSWLTIFLYLIAITLNDYYQDYLEEQRIKDGGFRIYILVEADPFPFALFFYMIFSIIRFLSTMAVAIFRVKRRSYGLA